IAHFRENNPAFKHKKFSKDALDAISEYSWPGNVRELQNVLHRTLLLSKADTITRKDLPADLITGNKISGSRLEDIEKNHILKILREAGGQRGRAAEILGIDPKTLYRKLMSYGIKE
ncbi:MAG: helix-turn-helix domain-containing protein, partial [Nitrospirota bacterium]